MFFVCFLAVLSLCYKEIPSVPEEFTADVTLEVMGMQVSGKYWRSYSNQVEKIETWGVHQINYYQCKQTYMQEQCTAQDMQDDQVMYPMQLFPFSQFVAVETIDSIECEHWVAEVDFMESIQMKFDFWVSNKTGSTDQWVVVRVIVNIDEMGMQFSSQMDFRNVVPTTFNVTETFIVPISECPEAPQDIETCSHHIFPPVNEKVAIFVVDLSGSMSTEEKMKAGGTETRLQVLQEQLGTIMSGLTPKQKFNVLGFSSSIVMWQTEPIVADSTNVSSAISWLKARQAGGATYMYDALTAAFKQDALEAIYFLTDGQPSVHSTTDILNMVKTQEAALPYDVKVHATNFFGSNPDFMQQLATSTGGVFTNIQEGQI